MWRRSHEGWLWCLTWLWFPVWSTRYINLRLHNFCLSPVPLICSAALIPPWRSSLTNMSLLSICVAVVLLVGVRAQGSVLRPSCNSSEAEEAAYAAQDYINGQHHHGYKFKLNQIEDFKIIPKVSQEVLSLYNYSQKTSSVFEIWGKDIGWPYAHMCFLLAHRW